MDEVRHVSIETQVVENASALTAIFGEWPSFHDAEVVKISLDRHGPTLEAQIHVFRMTDEIDSRGYYILTHHTLVTVRFVGIVLENLRWFNHQNVLSNLYVERTSGEESQFGDYQVHFGGCNGVEIDLICARIVIIAVEAYHPPA